MGKLQGRAEWHSSQRCLATRGHFTTQPVYTLFAVWRSCVLGAADTWLGYISALVTKRHEPQGGNHGSRDFCQRRTPVIAEELICNLKPISGQIRFQPWGSRRLLASAKAPEITSRGFEVSLDSARRGEVRLTDVSATGKRVQDDLSIQSCHVISSSTNLALSIKKEHFREKGKIKGDQFVAICMCWSLFIDHMWADCNVMWHVRPLLSLGCLYKPVDDLLKSFNGAANREQQ